MPGDHKKYVPSAEVGEYEQYRNKEKKKGGLYPLNEEGEYGPPPSALPPPLPGQQIFAIVETLPLPSHFPCGIGYKWLIELVRVQSIFGHTPVLCADHAVLIQYSP